MSTNLREIAGEQGLIDDFVILDEEPRLEGILTALTNFCHEEEPTKHQDPFQIPDEFESLAEKVTAYTERLISNYEKEDPFKLLFVTLEALEFLPAKDKEDYIDQFRSFVEKEGKCQNQNCIMPRIIKEVLSRVGAKYNLLFDSLNNGEAKSIHPRYQSQVSSLKEDLQIVIEYTQQKLSQNSNFDARAQNISYEECFSDNKIDLNKLTPEYVMELIENREVPQRLIDDFGMPIGTELKRDSKGDKTTMVIFHGKESNPNQVKVNYRKGINEKTRIFYLELSSQIEPISLFEKSTRNAINTLANRQFVL